MFRVSAYAAIVAFVSALLAGPAQAQPKDYWTSIYVGGHGGWAGSTIEFPLNPGPGGNALAGFVRRSGRRTDRGSISVPKQLGDRCRRRRVVRQPQRHGP